MSISGYDEISNLFSVYSVRKVVSAYSGNCVRLRRSSDSAESNFGFDGSGDLDTSAISTWLGGSTGYLVTWYDQGGNSYDVTQATTTAQPTYVASGINSLPTFSFDGGDYLDNSDAAVATAFSGAGNAASMSCVFRNTTATIFRAYMSIKRGASANPFYYIGRTATMEPMTVRRSDSGVPIRVDGVQTLASGSDYSMVGIYNGGSSENLLTAMINETNQGDPSTEAAATTLDFIRVGGLDGVYAANHIGYLSEVAYYSSAIAVTPDARDITRYQNDYFALYTVPTITVNNASDFLDIPTGEPSDTFQAMHPDVLDIDWNSKKYWMVMSPYTNSDVNAEDPHILVSDDGQTWTVPSGGSNPIYTSANIDGDPDILLGQDNKLYCYWFQNGSTDYIMESNSSDGTTWSTAAQMLTITSEGSPAAIYDGANYKMFTLDTNASPNGLKLRSSSSPNSGWGSASAVSMPTRNGRECWDINIFYEGSTYYGLFVYCEIGTSGEKPCLYYGTSTNGTTWTIDTEAMLNLTPIKAGFQSEGIYRSGAVKTATGWDIWYSAWNGDNKWHTAYTSSSVAASTARSFSVIVG